MQENQEKSETLAGIKWERITARESYNLTRALATSYQETTPFMYSSFLHVNLRLDQSEEEVLSAISALKKLGLLEQLQITISFKEDFSQRATFKHFLEKMARELSQLRITRQLHLEFKDFFVGLEQILAYSKHMDNLNDLQLTLPNKFIEITTCLQQNYVNETFKGYLRAVSECEKLRILSLCLPFSSQSSSFEGNDIQSELQLQIPKLKNLIDFRLNTNTSDISPIFFQSLSLALASLPNLRSISLLIGSRKNQDLKEDENDTSQNGESLEAFTRYLRNSTSIQHLNLILRGPFEINFKHTQNIMNNLIPVKDLQSLSLSIFSLHLKTKQDIEQCCNILTPLKQCPNLISLKLILLTSHTVQLLKGITNLSQIRNLDLYFLPAALSQKQRKQIYSILRTLSSLLYFSCPFRSLESNPIVSVLPRLVELKQKVKNVYSEFDLEDIFS